MIRIDDPRIAERGLTVERSGQRAAFVLPTGETVHCHVAEDGTLDLVPHRAASHAALIQAVTGEEWTGDGE